MIDKQQLTAMGEHMREMEWCKPEFKVPDGWKLVPVEANDDMLTACKDFAAEEYSLGLYFNEIIEIYQAMLAAAPEYKS